MKDNRVVFGAVCVWWDTIDKADKISETIPIPCCPHCRNVLLEVGTIEEWDNNVDRYEKENHPGYKAFMDWLRGKCFKNIKDAKAAYNSEGGEVTYG